MFIKNGSKNRENKDKVYDICEITEKFGNYQRLQYLLICLPAIVVTMININYVFVAGDLNYRCRIQQCDSPESTAQLPPWWPNSTADRCARPVLRPDHADNDTCSNSSFANTVEPCTEWIYESNNTIIADLNLGCQPWKSNLVGTVHNIGMLISMLISGWMSDRLGRKPTLIFCAVAGCVGILKTFTTSYYLYLFIELTESAVSGGIYASAMIIMIEIGGKKNRVLSGVLFAYAIYVGELIFACIAMLVPYWKTLVRIINSPTIIFLSYIFFLQESPRWQILNGKTEKAKETLRYAAKVNKIKINSQDLADIDEVKLKEKFNMEKYERKEGLIKIFTSKEIIKRLLVAAVCRFTASFVYYGMVVNSVILPGNKYTNFLLTTLMSFPGELLALYLMNKIGRKLPLSIGFVICGLLCATSAYVPQVYTWAKITLFMLGKTFISACFTGALTYSMELFPTSVRGSLLGLCAFSSRLGGMLAPLTPMLATVSADLPSILFGGAALISGALLVLTPETKNLPLMDTIEQVNITTRLAKDIKRQESNVKGNDNYGYTDETAVSSM